jgi:hypothetical protein
LASHNLAILGIYTHKFATPCSSIALSLYSLLKLQVASFYLSLLTKLWNTSRKWNNISPNKPKVWVFPYLPPGKIAPVIWFCWSPCSRMSASNFTVSFIFVSSQWWSLDLSFWFGMIYKKNLAYWFVSLAITSPVSGVQANSKYSRELVTGVF